MDAAPGWSQGKSLVQWMCGDTEGAWRTQVNFSQRFPFVSQVRSIVQLSQGDKKGAWETQKQFVGGVGDLVNGAPLVGHAKGVVHYVCGDREGGDRAMKSASRTTGVIMGATAGFMMGGPAGAAAGGVVGGAVTDGITTGVDSAVHNEFRPAGIVGQATNLHSNPRDPGQWVDVAGTVTFDALTGYGQGELIKRKRQTEEVPGGKVKQPRQQQMETEGKNMIKTEAEPTCNTEPLHSDIRQESSVPAIIAAGLLGGGTGAFIVKKSGEDSPSLHTHQASSKQLPAIVPVGTHGMHLYNSLCIK